MTAGGVVFGAAWEFPATVVAGVAGGSSAVSARGGAVGETAEGMAAGTTGLGSIKALGGSGNTEGSPVWVSCWDPPSVNSSWVHCLSFRTGGGVA